MNYWIAMILILIASNLLTFCLGWWIAVKAIVCSIRAGAMKDTLARLGYFKLKRP